MDDPRRSATEPFEPGKLNNYWGEVTYKGDPATASMANPAYVETLVRDLCLEVIAIRRRYNEAPAGNAAAEDALKSLNALYERWADTFSARNDKIEQRMSPTAQRRWLISEGYGEDGGHDPDESVRALVTATVKRIVDALMEGEQNAPDERVHFLVDTAIEDCTMALVGARNVDEG